jgi:hypothetical protein
MERDAAMDDWSRYAAPKPPTTAMSAARCNDALAVVQAECE